MKRTFTLDQAVTMAISVIAGVFLVVGTVGAATTISTNISTGGNLTVSGTASTTLFSATGISYFGGTATSTFSAAGVLSAVGNTSLVTASTTGAVSVAGALWVGGNATTTAAGAFSTGSTISVSATSTLASTTITHLAVGSTTPSQIAVAEAVIEGTATTTLQLSTSKAAPGGTCIQLEGPAGVNYRIYISGAGALVTEAGVCK
ncbi:hypothetical protein HY971_02260 [Candidatus Kaiserbacteria bacterium]|nr:hypothetical protein [Candidatus Kaiserbacteria bacterium]